MSDKKLDTTNPDMAPSREQLTNDQKIRLLERAVSLYGYDADDVHKTYHVFQKWVLSNPQSLENLNVKEPKSRECLEMLMILKAVGASDHELKQAAFNFWN